MMDGLQMHSDLMGASGLRHDLKKRVRTRASKYLISGNGFAHTALGLRLRGPEPEVLPRPSNGKLDLSFFLIGNPVYERHVCLVYFPFLKSVLQECMYFLCLRKYKHARRLSIETVHNAGTHNLSPILKSLCFADIS